MFANTLKMLRKRNGITQKELASIIGVEQSTVGKYEGKSQIIPSSDVLNRIADYFGVTVDYLLGRSDTSAPKAAALPQASALSPEEQRLLDAFRALNADGRRTAQTMLSSLAANPALTKDTDSEQMA